MNTTSQPQMDIDAAQAETQTPAATGAPSTPPAAQAKPEAPSKEPKKRTVKPKKKAGAAPAKGTIPEDVVSSARIFISSEAAELAGSKRAVKGETVRTAEVKPGYWKWWLDAGKATG